MLNLWKGLNTYTNKRIRHQYIITNEILIKKKQTRNNHNFNISLEKGWERKLCKNIINYKDVVLKKMEMKISMSSMNIRKCNMLNNINILYNNLNKYVNIYMNNKIKCFNHMNGTRHHYSSKKLNIIDPEKIRNVAIIAHVDHGKTTLVDKLLKQGGEITNNDRVMDHNDLERERGITIMSKVTRIKYDDYYFNIVDTPGHSDFGGEVERVLNLIDGVCLIIDVVEGPKNQTKFVLKKSLLNPSCKIIVIMNKFDKPSNMKKKEEIENEIFDLFVDLNAPEELMNYPILYASAKNGWCTDNFEEAKQNNTEKNDVLVIFKKIIEYIDSPVHLSKNNKLLEDKSTNHLMDEKDNRNENSEHSEKVFREEKKKDYIQNDETDKIEDILQVDKKMASISNNNNNNHMYNSSLDLSSQSINKKNEKDKIMTDLILKEPFCMLVSLIDHQEGVGVTVTGKIFKGVIKKGDSIIVKSEENKLRGHCVIKNIFYMKGLKIENVPFASAGDIVNISIAKGVTPSVNDTITSDENMESLKTRPIDPPVLCLKISQNTSPLTGKDGKHITLSSIGNRLKKEAAINIAIEISESEKKDSYEVKGRGELQLGILIEKLRREGYEMTISSPNVIYTKDEKGNLLEPIEEYHITIPSSMTSNVIEKLNTRKAEIVDIINDDDDNTFIKCICPSRNFFGMRSYLRDISKGTSIINSELKEYKKKQPSYKRDRNGVIISSSSGTTTAFSLDPIQQKGNLFVNENYPTYEGMIIGEHFLSNDIEMNAIKIKPVQHLRNKGHEDTIRINHKNITIEYALSFIQDDEEIEVTPKRIVMRKKILNTEQRKTANRKAKHG
ncbi:GTP-binding translation elongation factor tu family protein, putative [Plasmodium sp. gorilla clade G2]|uniref:GTP-binding translation elongation factor tu family protein, putative n=1 Tax=Plasmodium sp. gorilla clade G2 TaxID=880535 RepID=UPI000D227263|nr:GTP-binding translation elongation factor tu family protein, putative [Plasmodium sp. gorilla clade G2]SOV13042.1 GTP-binding translation elongation factor tu family protein, putative [Plasmodium sp. gorilla clade G2]